MAIAICGGDGRFLDCVEIIARSWGIDSMVRTLFRSRLSLTADFVVPNRLALLRERGERILQFGSG